MKNLQFHMFGEMILTDGENTLDEKKLHSKQLTQLLTCFIIYRNKALSHDMLISMFCRDNSKRPMGALKNLMHRLRSFLAQLGDENYICTQHGAYQWNPEIKVETDYEKIEILVEKMQKSENNQDKKDLCLQILNQYGTGISKEISGGRWISVRNDHLKELCFNTVQTLCEILKSEDDWKGLEFLYRRSLAEHLYGEKIRDWIGEYLESQKQDDFTDIENLMNKIRKNSQTGRTRFCSYETLCQIYRIEAERIKRLGLSEYILLLTVKQEESPPETERKLCTIQENDGMDILEAMLAKNLKESDVAVRYEPGQFILLRSNATWKSTVSLVRKLQKRFARIAGKKGYTLSCEFGELRSVHD